LGELEDARAETPLAAIVEPLATTLKDPDPSVRVMAASALGRRKDSRVIGHLEGALEDESELVRKAAAAVLAGFRDEESGEAPGGLDHTPSAS
jgi:HEAT repeat protein